MITLYTVPSVNGYKASIILEECGLVHDRVIVDAKAGDHKAPAFLKISPIGKLPAIVDHDAGGGQSAGFAETMAIALYCAEKSGKLLPTVPDERARALQWGAIISSGFSASFTMIFFGGRFGADSHAGIIEKGRGDLDNCMAGMEATLSASPWLAGSTFTIADALAIPMILINADRFDIDLARYPSVTRWRDEAAARPAVKRGMDY